MSKKTQIIALAVMGAVLVAVLGYQLTRKEPSPPVAAKTASQVQGASKTGTTAPTPAAAHAAKTASPSPASAAPSSKTQIKKVDVNIDELLANIKEVDFDYERERLPRDPMAPLVGTLTAKQGEGKEERPSAPPTAVQVMNKVVSGILWDERHPLAVVDNEVVHPGYVYADGVTVESIERDRVIFKVGDSLIQNPLKEF